MSEVLSSEDSNLAMNAICHAAAMTQETLRCAIGEYERPSVLFRPKIYFTVTGAPVYLAAGAALVWTQEMRDEASRQANALDKVLPEWAGAAPAKGAPHVHRI